MQFSALSGLSTGVLSGLSQHLQDDALLTLLVKEAIKTSAIEGEMISRPDVISSIKKNLGFGAPTLPIKDKRSEGIAELLVKSRTSFEEDLSAEMLFEWHKLLMRGNYSVAVGAWRAHSEPMQVVSGAMGREVVHFEAPPCAIVPQEMTRFIDWFNTSKPTGLKSIANPLIRASIAHLYFESIHPYEDGNGRIGRVVAEKALSQALGRPVLLSLSATIEADKNSYYHALQTAQRSNDCNEWIEYFAAIILESQRNFVQTIEFSLKKARFFDANKDLLNERQLKVVQRMLAEGEDGFLGGMNAQKYLSISKASKATATRDLQALVEKQVLIAKGQGRARNYQVNLA